MPVVMGHLKGLAPKTSRSPTFKERLRLHSPVLSNSQPSQRPLSRTPAHCTIPVHSPQLILCSSAAIPLPADTNWGTPPPPPRILNHSGRASSTPLRSQCSLPTVGSPDHPPPLTAAASQHRPGPHVPSGTGAAISPAVLMGPDSAARFLTAGRPPAGAALHRAAVPHHIASRSRQRVCRIQLQHGMGGT